MRLTGPYSPVIIERLSGNYLEFSLSGQAALHGVNEAVRNESPECVIAAVRQGSARLVQYDFHVRLGAFKVRHGCLFSSSLTFDNAMVYQSGKREER